MEEVLKDGKGGKRMAEERVRGRRREEGRRKSKREEKQEVGGFGGGRGERKIGKEKRKNNVTRHSASFRIKLSSVICHADTQRIGIAYNIEPREL